MLYYLRDGVEYSVAKSFPFGCHRFKNWSKKG